MRFPSAALATANQTMMIATLSVRRHHVYADWIDGVTETNISIAEARSRLSRYLGKLVGEDITITRKGKAAGVESTSPQNMG